MKLPNRKRPRAPARARQRRYGQQGFSLTEVMIAGAVGGVIITTVARMNNLNQKIIQTSTQREQAEAAVNSDINTIRQKMVNYTWCAGQGSITPSADSSRCRKSLIPGVKPSYYHSGYYSPNQNTPDAANNPGDRDKFKAACQDTGTSNNSFLSGLIASIDAQVLPSSAGVTRTVTISDGRAKRLQITYSSDTLNRSLLMTPTVAAWCP
jgi:prepilin-type N-terminal cleavage/methylation domain-containing protein